MIRVGRVAATLLLVSVVGCGHTVHPLQLPNPRALPPAEFAHSELDRVLGRFVNEDGLVDYGALDREPFVLGTYLGQLAAYSPVSHPALFADSDARLAYWLNAYNAVALRLVLEHYPITSVQDVTTWWTAALPAGAGFFYAQRFPLGGHSTSLYTLENRIVRRGFPDPRIHFALNCASLGCPVLPRHAFDPAKLDEQLARETHLFLAEPRNFRIDETTRTAWLSAIFDWYEGDFTKWQAQRGRPDSLLAFVADHATSEVAAAATRAASEGFAVRFHEYDWRLNDQALGPRPIGE